VARNRQDLERALSTITSELLNEKGYICFVDVFMRLGYTYCLPSNNSTSLLSYQSLPTSSALWRGHGQEAKRGEVGAPRIPRQMQRWRRCASCVSPPGCPPLAVSCLSGATPRGQPWTSAVTHPHGRNGLNARRMAVLSTCHEPSLGRHVHRALWRSVLLALTPRISATACHQRNDVERYSRFITRTNRIPCLNERFLPRDLHGRLLHTAFLSYCLR
jgi:hypothetical protein